MSSITWSVPQTFQFNQSDFYWKAEADSTTILLGLSAYPLLVIPKVEYPRLISFSILPSPHSHDEIISFYFDKPTSTAEHLNILDAMPDFQCRVGHQQLNWENSAGIYAKYNNSNSLLGVKITYRCLTKQVIA